MVRVAVRTITLNVYKGIFTIPGAPTPPPEALAYPVSVTEGACENAWCSRTLLVGVTGRASHSDAFVASYAFERMHAL